MRLPVIVGFGGINAAGRSSRHHSYRRMVIDALSPEAADHTWASLAALMGIAWDGSDATRQQLTLGTLVRRIEPSWFDVDQVPWNQPVEAEAGAQPISFNLATKWLPRKLPASWRVTPMSVSTVRVEVDQSLSFLLPDTLEGPVKVAGQLPSGFDPGALYPSRNHPRGLQMTIYAASDMLANTGVSWQTLSHAVPPDQVSVYVGSGMSQLDANANGGMIKARANGRRVTSKYCPFGFAEMPADFINAYVLGSMGTTGTSMGACASFLYNLRSAVGDIQSGRSRLALVGSAEAPVVAEVMEGYAAMGALANDKGLRKLDGLRQDQAPDYRRACRPFGDNCGFTIAESAQCVLLCDDQLAVELGLSIHGAVTDVFINADGHKKSISSPGVGNYITMAKATAAARALLGVADLRSGGLVQAHGTGTPQNRVTESHILNSVAQANGITDWPVVAVKSHLGHSIGAAAADQLVNTLGIWQHAILPGITTVEELAADVHSSHLQFVTSHQQVDPALQRYAIINAKGFGGNNASATVLAPGITGKLLRRRHGEAAMAQWQQRNEAVQEQLELYDRRACSGPTQLVYHFDHQVLDEQHVSLSHDRLRIGELAFDLDLSSPYEDML